MYATIRKLIPLTWFCALLLLAGCKDDDINKFDKTADERVAEAIADLKGKLVSPANGWKLHYTPEDGYGSFLVLLNFQENDMVTIKTDLWTGDNKFYEQTVGYRIDSRLGLELIIENFSFFSYLFELDQATFGAEYEFLYKQENDNGSLLFTSKSDDSNNPTQLLFTEATTEDLDDPGKNVAPKVTAMSNDLQKITTSLRLTYATKDLIFYLSLQEDYRILTVTSASRKSNINSTQQLNFTTGYYFRNDSIVFQSPLAGNFAGVAASIKGIKIDYDDDDQKSSLTMCTPSIPIHGYEGVTSAGDNVLLETTLADAAGAAYQNHTVLYAPINNLAYLGESAYRQVIADLPTATYFLVYNNIETPSGPFTGIGFRVENPNNTYTFAMLGFEPVLDGNHLSFNFDSDFTQTGTGTTSAENLAAIRKYIEYLTENNNTYIFQYSDGVYEFNNPCSGWSALLINGDE